MNHHHMNIHNNNVNYDKIEIMIIVKKFFSAFNLKLCALSVSISVVLLKNVEEFLNFNFYFKKALLLGIPTMIVVSYLVVIINTVCQ
jgi:DhnA family fructose-bisphosphate aldolase class Ia